MNVYSDEFIVSIEVSVNRGVMNAISGVNTIEID